MKIDLNHLFLSGSISFCMCIVHRSSEDGLLREGCKLEGVGHHFNGRCINFECSAQDSVGVRKKKVHLRVERGQAGPPRGHVLCSYPPREVLFTSTIC